MHARHALHATLVFILAALLPAAIASTAEPPHILSIFDARPIAEAATELQRRHGWITTYEDPRYEHIDDIEDVTDRVSRVPNPARRVLVPRAAVFEFQYDLAPGPEAILGRMLDEHRASNGCCAFRLERYGNTFHIVPASARNASGDLQPQHSPLDYRVSLAPRERTADEFVTEMCAAITQSSGLKVVSNAPTNLMHQTRVQLGAENEVARTVLLRALAVTGRKLSWRLFYSPSPEMYALNITLLPELD